MHRLLGAEATIHRSLTSQFLVMVDNKLVDIPRHQKESL